MVKGSHGCPMDQYMGAEGHQYPPSNDDFGDQFSGQQFGDIQRKEGLQQHHQQHHQPEEIGCSVVSSTSQQEQEGVGGKGVVYRQHDNIGSIITMLIADQSVDLEDILIDPNMSPASPGLDRQGLPVQTEIKEEEDLTTDTTHLNVSGLDYSAACYPQNTHDYSITHTGYYNPRTDYSVNQASEEAEVKQDNVGRSRSLSSLSSSSEGDEEHVNRNFRANTSSYDQGMDSLSHQPGQLNPADRSLLQRNGTSGYMGQTPSSYRQGLVLPGKHPGQGGTGDKRDDKYWERRRKNNLAAKKSRDARRVRENQLRLRVLCLENANRVLREQMDRKHLETVQLRERLSKYETVEENSTSKM